MRKNVPITTQAEVPEDGPLAWGVFDEVFANVAEALPVLGLRGSAGSALHVRRVHGAALIAAGVARKARSGRWLAHRTRLGPALFELLTLGPDEVIAAARARGQAEAPAPAATV